MAISAGIKFKDLNYRLGESGQPPVLQGDAAVRTALKNLLTSYTGCRSRIFNQRWGSSLIELLQEPIGQVTAGALKAATIATIKAWEPRIQLIDSACTVLPNYDLPGYDIKLVYKINDSNTVYAYLFGLEP